MKTLAIAMLLMSTAEEPLMSTVPTEAEELSDRCISVEPICPPGKHAICLCESDISLRCAWVCASM